MRRLSNKARITTGVASEILQIPSKTIMNYDSFGLSAVRRSSSGRRLFSEMDLFKILVVNYLTQVKHISYAGTKFFISLRDELLSKKKIDLYDYIIPKQMKEDFIARITTY